MKRSVSALALVLAAGAAHAQSINIDFNNSVGAGAGIPDATFGGPAGQPGAWNAMSSWFASWVPLAGLDGALTSASLTRATNGTFVSTNSAATTGNYDKLMDDYQQVIGGSLVYTFNGLQNGLYVVYTCAADPASGSNRSDVQVSGAAANCILNQPTGGVIPADSFKPGVTHAVHTAVVTNGQLVVTINEGFLSGAVISGIQLVKVDGARHRLHVDYSATGGNDGGSWASAYTDPQDALRTATLGGGSQFDVWVANGSYEPTTGTDRYVSFHIPTGLHFYGGFSGNETQFSQRGAPLSAPTYLSGNIGASGNADDSYTVVILNGADSDTIMDGFFIARGNNDGGLYAGHGGGMTISDSFWPIIRNCDFTTNRATNGGAGLYVTNSTAVVGGSVFYNGSASNGVGGAIEARGPGGALYVQNTRFLGNDSIGYGGAISVNNMNAELANCLFSGNSASDDGGAVHGLGGDEYTVRLFNSTLSRNHSSQLGGGLYIGGGMDVEVQNSILWGNTADLAGGVSAGQVAVVTSQGSTFAGAYNTQQGVNADPLFVDADGADNIAGNFDDNCRLLAGSPCIDQASNISIQDDLADLDGDGNLAENNPFDLDMNARRVETPASPNGGQGTSPIVDRGCYEFVPAVCYANCDDSTTAPVLNVSDFSCFLNRFAAGDSYANCDHSTTAPVLNVADFSCFLNAFAAGCP